MKRKRKDKAMLCNYVHKARRECSILLLSLHGEPENVVTVHGRSKLTKGLVATANKKHD